MLQSGPSARVTCRDKQYPGYDGFRTPAPAIAAPVTILAQCDAGLGYNRDGWQGIISFLCETREGVGGRQAGQAKLHRPSQGLDRTQFLKPLRRHVNMRFQERWLKANSKSFDLSREMNEICPLSCRDVALLGRGLKPSACTPYKRRHTVGCRQLLENRPTSAPAGRRWATLGDAANFGVLWGSRGELRDIVRLPNPPHHVYPPFWHQERAD